MEILYLLIERTTTNPKEVLMNYGVKATKKRIRAANSRKKKYANRLFLTFFKTAFVLVLFLCVTGVSTFIGMFKGILDSSPDFNPDSFTPSGYFSTIYNSAGEVTDTLVGSNSNRIEASYEDFPQDLIDAFVSIEDSRFWQHNGIDLRSISWIQARFSLISLFAALLPEKVCKFRCPLLWKPLKK